MGEVALGTLLWEPAADARQGSNLGRFLDWVATTRDVELPDYDAAWRWSVDDLEAFWGAVIEWFDLPLAEPYERVLADDAMPGARWLPGARLNYAEQALRWRGGQPAIVARSQTRDDITVTRDELRVQVAAVAAGLRGLGVGPGDRVVGYLPNIPETIVAFLACASIGAVWSSCAPEFGVKAVVDRVRQIEPTVLLAVDGYRYGDRVVDRAAEIAAVRDALPSLRATVVLPYLTSELDRHRFPGAREWRELLVEPAADEVAFAELPFEHPLYVLYSSGTTGLPKPIVHGHGGILLEHVKMLGLHHDLGEDSVFTWFTTTGWMMWNYLVSGLTVGATVVLFDGNPGHPDLSTLWRLVADVGVDVFGVGAPFLMSCRKADLQPGRTFDLAHLRQIGSTGSPLPPEGFAWVRDAVGEHVQVVSASGGTDVCTAFVAAAPLLPVHAGEIPCRCLGASVVAYDADGNEVIGERGELVITRPMPSMPVGFWGDDDGSRYRAAYFEDFPGVWRHGDWLEVTDRGTCIITGRSDATLNRGGVRMGTAEFYAVVEDVAGIADSLVVHLTGSDEDRLLLFVVTTPGHQVDDDLRGRLAAAIRAGLSPRHVPDDVIAVPAIPRTISGKKMEVPVKRLLAGEPVERVANPGAMANPGSLDAFVADRR